MPVPLHNPWMNLDANLGFLSLMNFSGSPNCGKTCWMISPAVSSAVIASLHGVTLPLNVSLDLGLGTVHDTT